MSENKYRDYLNDDHGFYRQYLQKGDEPVGSSSFGKVIMGSVAAVGVAAGTAAAYRHGAFRLPLERFIDNLAHTRKTTVGQGLDSVREWTNDVGWNEIKQMDTFLSKINKGVDLSAKLPEILRKNQDKLLSRREKLKDSPINSDKSTELGDYIKQFERVLKKEQKANNQLGSADFDAAVERSGTLQLTEKLMHDVMRKKLVVDRESQQLLEKRTGYRQATVRDTYEFLAEGEKKLLNRFEERLQRQKAGYSIMDKIIDSNILLKKGSDGNQFADLRDFRDGLSSIGDSLAYDFTIPFIKINPFRMLYLNELTKHKTPQLFANMRSSQTVQPFLNRQGEDFKPDLYADGWLYRFNSERNQFDRFESPVLLADARNNGENSFFARNTRSMMDLQKFDYTPSDTAFRGKIWEPIMKKLDLGFQERAPGRNPDIGDPSSPLNWAAGKFYNGFGNWNGLRPYQSRVQKTPAFGEGAEHVAIPRHKTLEEVNADGGGVSDFFRQIWASRNSAEDVTTSSFILYTAAERLNATISQIGMGISGKHLGSAQQIMAELTLKRVVPILAVVEGYKFTNYAYEKAVGDEYEDQLWGAFTRSQQDIAKAAEFLGVTQMAKDITEVMPGIEFLSELPIPVLTTEGMTPIMLRDLLPMDKTADEIAAYYASGEEKVRKGRYWEFGTTPLTGGKVSWHQPNWYRRITTDWEYTDTLWGSKDEYWDNHFAVSPIRHFIADPYHYDKKHYEDRPYMKTGGIPVLEELPLIGGLVNATVGQVFKPTLDMHTEEWGNPNHYKELQGYQLAEALNLVNQTGSVGSGVPGARENLAIAGSVAGTATQRSGYSGNVAPGQQLAYITSGGNISVMRADEATDLFDANMALRNGGIAQAGFASAIRMDEGVTWQTEQQDGISSMHAALTDVYFNTTEMAGFYGWMGATALGQSDQNYKPRFETSSKIYGYNRQFWDAEYGNIGGDGMEIMRRFIPDDKHKNYINHIDNNMPTWMAGADYFTNFQVGDPYAKLKRGEMRLPGDAYEVMYGIDSDKLDRMEVGASLIGYDVEKIVGHLLHRDDVEDDQKAFVTERGTDWHEEWEADMRALGVTLSDEEYVKDEASGIGGFYDVLADHQKGLDWLRSQAVEFTYYEAAAPGTGNSQEGYYNKVVVSDLSESEQDAYYRQFLARSDKALIDPKTRTGERFQEDEMHFANVQQVNFYASEMNTPINYLIHVDITNENEASQKPIKVFAFEQSDELLAYSKDKVGVARSAINQMLEDGAIGRGDLYDAVDRYRILADTAPYSDEFRRMKSQLSRIDMSPEEREEIREINAQLSERKDNVRTFDYRFKTANVETMKVTVKKVLDNNTFLTEEFSDNPIRLAGVYVPNGQDEAGQAATAFMKTRLKEGQKVQISVTADRDKLVNKDTYRTIDAVVHSGTIRNLNRELISRGLAREEEDDYSAAGVHARFSDMEIAFGSAWETIAHLDTPFNTKLLHVASPLEEYKRREVYGKSYQDWQNPIDDYLIPWYQNWVSKAPLAAITMGAFIGQFFGDSKYGKVMGGLIGATSAGAGVLYSKIHEVSSGRKWVPERREKERDINEYFDMLKYVKYRGLYEQAADMALRSEGFDVRAYMEDEGEAGERRKSYKAKVQEAKRLLMTSGYEGIKAARKLVGRQANPDAYMKALNGKLEEIESRREVAPLTPMAADAIRFYQESEKTLYGYDIGDPLQNAMSALPKKDRDYMGKFIDAPEEERDEILEVVPDYMRRILQASWGMEVDPKPTLEGYFQQHGLPDDTWSGWDPRADLNAIKLKVVQKEGLNQSEFNMWRDDEVNAANVRSSEVPRMHQKMDPTQVQRKLRDVLGEAGFKNLQIDVEETREQGIEMNVNVRKDRREEARASITTNAYAIL